MGRSVRCILTMIVLIFAASPCHADMLETESFLSGSHVIDVSMTTANAISSPTIDVSTATAIAFQIIEVSPTTRGDGVADDIVFDVSASLCAFNVGNASDTGEYMSLYEQGIGRLGMYWMREERRVNTIQFRAQYISDVHDDYTNRDYRIYIRCWE